MVCENVMGSCQASCQQPILQLVAPLRQMVQSPEGPPQGPPPTPTSLGQGAPARYKQPLSVEPEGHGSCTPKGSLFPGLVGSLSNQAVLSLDFISWCKMTISSFLDVVKMKTGSPGSRCITLFLIPKKAKGQRAYLLSLFPKCEPKRSRELKTLVFLPLHRHHNTPVPGSSEVLYPQNMAQFKN